ncbi:MAG TPA: iron-containing alcohol dehydrogenase [Novosphingobium sp.]
MRIFGAPRQYIQGPGVLSGLGAIAERCRAQPLLILDQDIAALLAPALAGAFAAPPPAIHFGGQITGAAIERLTAEARALLDTESYARLLVYGIGGGKALDAAKGVALRIGADFVAVPTVASNDSPTGRAVAIYDDAYKLARVDLLPANPEAVVVDTALIVQAPARFLRGGIGDAIAKKFEAERSHADGALNFFGTAPLLSALALADACYTTLRRHGAGGMRAAAAHEVTPDFEATVEAALLMSGIAWESGGTSLSHAVVRGLARTPGAQASLHGEHVAYGLLVQLAIEQRSDAFILDLMGFYREIGQACTLAGLGIADAGKATLAQIAQWTHEGPKGSNAIVSATPDEVIAALQRVEALAAA